MNTVENLSYLIIIKNFIIVAFTKFIVFAIKFHNDTIEKFFIPYFPYPLSIYKNPKQITYVDSNSGLRLDNRIRLKYLINHDNNLEKILSYISKMDTRLVIMFRDNNNILMINMMDIDNKSEIFSAKEYEFNTLKLYSKPVNKLIPE